MAEIWVDGIRVTRADPFPIEIPWSDELNEVVPFKERPLSDPVYAPDNANSGAQAASLIVKAQAGILYGLSVYSNGVSQWIQIHDAALLPADAVVPTLVFEISSDTSRTFDFGRYGRKFTNGIVICNSTTDVTKTIGAANCIIDAQYK